LLSLFGLEGIRFKNPEIAWVPESELEREELQVYGFEAGRKGLADPEIPPLSFDLAARAVLAAESAIELETPLAFFRRGMIDVYNREYVEAIYDFFFFIETVFGEGKFRKAALREAFVRAQPLRNALQEALDDPGLALSSSRELRRRFAALYAGKDVDQIIDHILELRGELHHHSSGGKTRWSPDDPEEFEVQALFLQRVILLWHSTLPNDICGTRKLSANTCVSGTSTIGLSSSRSRHSAFGGPTDRP